MTDHDDRRMESGNAILMAYAAIAKVLAKLPVPISLPGELSTEYRGTDVANSLLRAVDLVWDLPMGERTKTVLHQAVLDWLTAQTFYTMDDAMPAEWRLDTVDYAIARVALQIERVNEALDAGKDL